MAVKGRTRTPRRVISLRLPPIHCIDGMNRSLVILLGALAGLVGRRAKVAGVQGESRDACESLDQGRRGLGEGHRRHVVWDSGPEGDHVDARVVEAHLER